MTGTAKRRFSGLAVAIALLSAGCSGHDENTILVLGAASLTNAFETLAEEFEATRPGVDVELSFAGSNSLGVQIEQGAPADVVALANADQIDALVSTGQVMAPTVFATNSLVLATPTPNPGNVDSIDDLADPDLLIGVCAPTVPCGVYADRVLSAAGVVASLDTEEPNVRSLVAKLTSGELDAGFVYATDLQEFGDELRMIALPESIDVRAEYPIARVTDSPNALVAQEFIEFVTSAEGQAILRAAGFGPA
jgi:molybdate transport system substrate-binding protein